MFSFGRFESTPKERRRSQPSRWIAGIAAFALGSVGLAATAAPVSATASVSISNIPAVNGVVGQSFTPSFTGGYAGTASVTSSTTSVCTVASGVVSFLAVGTCTLTASASDPLTGAAQSFNVGSQKVFDGPNGEVDAIAQDSNGNTYLGGQFDGFAAQPGGSALLSDASSSTVAVDRTFPKTNGTIYASVADGSGGWYIGGNFTTVDGLERMRAAHILANGSVDSAWNPRFNGAIKAMVKVGSTIYVGGEFGAVGVKYATTATTGLTASSTLTLTKYDSSIQAGDAVWGPYGYSATTTVSSIGSCTDGASCNITLSVSTTQTVGTTTGPVYFGSVRKFLAAVGTDGTLQIWNPSASASVLALAVSGSTIYAGGTFTSVGPTRTTTATGTSGSPLLVLASTDSTVAPWDQVSGNGVAASTTVTAVSTSGGVTILTLSKALTANVTSSSGAITLTNARKELAAIGTDGTIGSLSQNFGGGQVNALTVSGSSLYVGGSFTNIVVGTGTCSYVKTTSTVSVSSVLTGTKPAVGLVITSTGSGIAANTTITNGSNSYTPTTTLTISAANSAISNQTAKTCTWAYPRAGLLSVSTTDGSLTSFNPALDSSVSALAVYQVNGADYIAAGGAFGKTGSTFRSHAASWLASDNSLSSWDPSLNGNVNSLAVSGSNIYLAGTFTQVGGGNPTRNKLAVVDTSGTLNSTWDPNANNDVSHINVSGSSVLVSGSFATIGPKTTRNRLAALDSNDTLTSWNPNANGAVFALAVTGSTVYVGGQFTTIGSSTRNYVAAIGTDGTLSTTFDPNLNNTVYALATDGTTVYLGGTFTTVGGGTTARNRLASYLVSDGSLTSWDGNASAEVDALTIANSKIYAAGQFGQVAGGTQVRSHWAAWNTSDGSISSITSSTDNGLLTLASDSNGVVYTGGYNTTSQKSCYALGTDGTQQSWITNSCTGAGSAMEWAMAVGGSTVYIGGQFTTPGTRLVATPIVGATGAGTFTDWRPAPQNGKVTALLATSSSVYAGGTFTSTNYTDGQVSGLVKLSKKSNVALYPSPYAKTISVGTAIPSIGYSAFIGNAGAGTSGVTSSSDWTTEPSCGVYAQSDQTYATALSGSSVAAGTYNIHCTSGSSATYRTANSADGVLTITKISTTVTASSPASVDSNAVMPSVSYTTSPATTSSDWSTQPTCAVYASSDTTYATPLTGAQAVGTYVTHCSGGTSATYNPTSYVNGSLTVTKPNLSVTASSPSAIDSATALPAITYTTSPSTTSSDWTAQPTCAVYASTDTTYATPLTGIQPAGTYVTHCSGGTSSAYQVSSRVDGSLTVTVGPSSYTVTNCNDSGVGSLRYALALVGPGATISFNVSCSTISPLTTLYLTKDVTINGPTSPGLTIDGSSEAALGTYDPGTGPWAYKQNPLFVNGGVNATIRNLTFQHGTSIYGGAIYVQGSTSSSAYTNLRVENSTFKNNQGWLGGAIVSANASTDSSAYYGPDQVHLYANLTVVNSTFANNSTIATGDGGAIDNGEYGGYGTVRILGSTFTGNRSDFGVLDNCDDLTYAPAVHGSTCTAAMYVSGSVFANAGARIQSAAATDEFNSDPSYGTVKPIDLGYNISEDSTFGFTQSTSVTSSPTINASLAALASNGGPTQTVLPSSSSPAVAAIPASTTVTLPASTGVTASSYQLCSRTDQRGVASGGTGRCTIGSVEVVVKTSVAVTASSPSSVNSATALPSVGYTTSPSTVAGDWTAEPTCSVYSTTDTGYTNPLTGAHSAGTYVTHCSGGTSSTYNPTSYVNGSLTVTSASTNVAVTAATSSITYGASIPSVGYTTSPSTVAGDWTSEPSCAVYSTTDTTFATPLSGQHSAGTYVTHCAGGSSASYSPTSYVDGVFTIDQAASTTTVTCSPKSTTYSGVAQMLCSAAVTGAGGLSVSGLTPSYTSNTNAGTSTATYIFAGDANHAGSQGSDTFSINAATVVVTADSPSITYGDSIPSVTYSSSPTTVAGDWTTEPSCSVYSTADTTFASPLSGVHSAGTYVTHCSNGSSSNYTTTVVVDGSLTINKAASTTVITCPASITYSGSYQEPCIAAVTGVGGLSTTATVTYANNRDAGTGLADSTYAGDANHMGSDATQSSFTIDKASTSTVITCPAAHETYDGGAHTPCSADVTGAGLTTTATVNYTNNTNAGTATADASYSGDSNHTSSTATQSGFTISQAPSSVTVNCPSNVTYDGSAQQPCSADVYGPGGLAQGLAVSYSSNTDAGPVSADATFGGDANHQGSSGSSGFTIDQASSSTTVTCSPKSATYSGIAQALCSASVSGAGGLTLTGLTPTYTANTNVGTVTASYAYSGDSNHTGSNGSDTFAISPSAVVVTPSSPTITYGASIPSITYTTSPVTTASDWTTEPVCDVYATADTTFATPLTGVVGAGSYVTHCSNGSSSNYTTSSSVAGTLTVNKAASTTSITCPTAHETYTASAITPCTATVTRVAAADTTTAVTYGANTNAGTATADATYAGDSNHNGSSATQSSFVIDKATSATLVTCGAASYTYTGSAIEDCSATATGAGALSTPVTVTYSTDHTNVGTASADATFTGDANHLGSTASTVYYSITKASSATLITCPTAHATYTGSAQTPCSAAVTGAGGLSTTETVVYGSNTNAGTATADATYAGDSNHNGSTATQSSFVIDKASSATIITCTPSSVTYTGSAQTPCAAAVTGAGGLSTTVSVTYGANTNAGTATADASYAGDANHNGSTATQSSFVIAKAASTTVVTCSPTSVTYTGSAQTPCGSTAVVTGAGGLSTTVSVVYAANTNAGTATANATYAGDANHNGSSATQQTFTIAKAASATAISCAPSYTYTGSAIENCTAAVTGAGGLSTSVTPTYSTDHTNVGNVAVNASYGGDANHNSSSATSSSFAITKASSSTVISCPSQVTYNAAAQTPCSVAVTGAGGLNTTVAITYANNTLAGTATANASYAGDSNHNGSAATQVSFTIAKNPVVVSAPILSTTYGTAVPTIGYSTSPSTVAGDWTTAPTCAIYAPLGVVALTGVQPVGTYETRCSGGVSVNFSAVTYAQGSLTITPAPSTTTITCVAASYTGSAVTPCTATVTGAGLTTITATPTYSNNINAGTNTASATYTWTPDANHTGSSATVTFTIGQAVPTVTITCSPTSVVYTGVAQTPCGTTATVTAAGGLSTTVPVAYSNNIDVAAATAATAPTATASYSGGGNYLAVSVFKTFAITKAASVTVAVVSPSVAYSATLPTITATAPAGGFTTNPNCGVYATAAATTALTGAQNVGTYVTKCSGGVAKNFTAITYTSGTLTITKAATVSVTASTPAAITYGAALPTVTSTTPGGGWTTAPTCGVYTSTGTTALTGVQNAGSYVTKCSGGVALNYTAVTYVNGALTINKAATTSVTASSAAITYGAALPTITSTTPTGGWTTAPTCGVYANATSTTRLTGTQNAGSYVTKCSVGVAVNYTAVTYVNGTLTINKASVTITAQTRTGTRGGAIPTPTYTSNPTTATYTTVPTCRVYNTSDTTFATPLTGNFPNAAGTYVTRCSGAVSTNYTPTYVNGTITVA